MHALLLGIVEGITEFLPISSTAHLILASHALGSPRSEFLKSFEIIIQLGAILSVVVLYWKRFSNIDVLKKLVVAVIPTGVIGLTVYKAIKGYLLGNLTVVLLVAAHRRHRAHRVRALPAAATTATSTSREITYRKAFLIGLFQAIAVIPGVSRSAATIVGGSLLGVSKRTIVEFSFMLAVPTMLAATGLELLKSRSALSGNFGVLGDRLRRQLHHGDRRHQVVPRLHQEARLLAFGWYRIVLAVVFYLVFLR